MVSTKKNKKKRKSVGERVGAILDSFEQGASLRMSFGSRLEGNSRAHDAYMWGKYKCWMEGKD